MKVTGMRLVSSQLAILRSKIVTTHLAKACVTEDLSVVLVEGWVRFCGRISFCLQAGRALGRQRGQGAPLGPLVVHPPSLPCSLLFVQV